MLEHLPPHVKIVEVGPRDGLQNEPEHVPTAQKVALIQALAGAGLQHIEITSFVSPKWIPQLADSSQVAAAVKLPPLVKTSALVPNIKGYEAAKAAGLEEIAVFMSATETHSHKNINKSINEAMVTVAEVIKIAKADGKRVRGYLSVVFACPYEGRTNAVEVVRLSNRLFELGVDELSLGDTIGAAVPTQVRDLLQLVTSDKDKQRIALHFHDTRGTALANVVAGLDSGVTIFDASIGGMGGCPYAPGAAGNLATEDLVYLLHEMGVDTGVDLEKLVDCGELAQEIVKRKLPGRYLQACLANRAKRLQQQQKVNGTVNSNVLTIEKEAPITWLKLNRPRVHNSLNTEMLKALIGACQNLASDKETRVVVITGAGTKVFCAGADLTERKGMTEGQVIGYLNLIQQTMLAIENLPQPVIAAINGSAYGGGTELALACDLRVMTEEAVLRLTEVKLGIIPGAGGTQRLTRLIGKSRAKEIILTARPIGSREAFDLGLVHKLCPVVLDGDEQHTELLNQVRLWSREIATAAPLALKSAKYAIDQGSDRDLAAGGLETKAYLQLLNTRDRLEGLAAFAEKREPVYIGE